MGGKNGFYYKTDINCFSTCTAPCNDFGGPIIHLRDSTSKENGTRTRSSPKKKKDPCRFESILFAVTKFKGAAILH